MLAKLWSFDRKVKKLAPIESFEDLKKKAIEVGVCKESPDIKVYLEDGTEVDEGAFKYIADARVQECSTFVFSTTPWTSVTEPVGGTSHPDSTVSVSVGFVNSVTFCWESLSAAVLAQLRNGKQLDRKAVHELVRMVVTSMEKAKQRPSARDVRLTGRSMNALFACGAAKLQVLRIFLQSTSKEDGVLEWLLKAQQHTQGGLKSALSVALIPMLLSYFKENMNFVFRVYENTTSISGELEELPATPVVIALGKSIFDAQCLLAVDRERCFEQLSFLEAIELMFASYYCLNIQYPSEVATTLEFMQRQLIGINPTEGTRQSGKKKRTFHPGVLAAMTAYKVFQGKWKNVL